MRILLIHRYFWPDTPPYASMLRSIGHRLVKEGHEVTVLSSLPSYKSKAYREKQIKVENVDGMKVFRIALFPEYNRHVVFRVMNMLYFPLRVFMFSMLKKRFHLIMVSTAPPVVLGFFAALKAKVTGAIFFYHCMDIHPEIGRISGEFKNPAVFALMKYLDNISCRIAKRIIVLSNDMERALLTRPGLDTKNIQIINNFSLPYSGDSVKIEPELLKSPDKFRIIFAGNIGRFQGLESLIDVMENLVHLPTIELVFVGEGSALCELKKRAYELENVKFLPHQTVDVARKIISNADLGVVSLSHEIYQYAYPSKTMTYLEEGCPLLVSVERDSELVKFVESSKAGVWIGLNNPESVAVTIESLYLDPERHEQMKKAAKAVSKKEFSEMIVLDKWVKLINDSVENE